MVSARLGMAEELCLRTAGEGRARGQDGAGLRDNGRPWGGLGFLIASVSAWHFHR